MPTLNWIGKDKIITHDQDVPFKILDHQYGFTAGKGEQKTETNSGNMIIHGDNLEALKSLLPKYEGKIKCIYIDPPYNTGNENWVYNDNVNSPKIKKWLGEVVGKEGEDLTRHDKWLCMMYPRLKLLHRLLANDGAIFISIDDNEQANLRLICDEIFGGNNFLANIMWQKRTSPDARIQLGDAHEFVIVYAKHKNIIEFNKLPFSSKQKVNYKNPDNDPRGLWTSSDFTAQGFRPNQVYSITTPSGKIITPPKDRCWKNIESVFLNLVSDNRIWFGQDGTGVPRRKTFLAESEGISSWTWWQNEDVGHSQEAKQEVKFIFLENDYVFDTPKPIRLINRILQIASDKNSIILDSFAGSGTTAHAVLNLNKEDGGNRKFILIEMEDYADSITAERVKRVAKGYGADKKQIEGTGGSFDYYALGAPLFDDNQNLNESIGIEKIREYIWFSETRTAFTEPQADPYFLGSHSDTAYYFVYEKDSLTTLDYDALQLVKHKSEQYIIYADNCLLPKEFMTQHHIIFKKIPRDITRF